MRCDHALRNQRTCTWRLRTESHMLQSNATYRWTPQPFPAFKHRRSKSQRVPQRPHRANRALLCGPINKRLLHKYCIATPPPCQWWQRTTRAVRKPTATPALSRYGAYSSVAHIASLTAKTSSKCCRVMITAHLSAMLSPWQPRECSTPKARRNQAFTSRLGNPFLGAGDC